jgi:hypothetical protein
MSFPKEKPFNAPVSKVHILGPSSGDPNSFQDPKSVASIGSTIQAMSDQAKADTHYDAPAPKVESFANPTPWIVNSQACRRESFANPTPWIVNSRACKREAFADTANKITATSLAVVGISLILYSAYMKR